jgi:hypothetical protein
MRRIVPVIVVSTVLAAGLWLWLPPGENPDRYSDLGAALISGAVVAFAALYLQWRLSLEVSRQQRIHDAQFKQYFELWSQLQKLRQAADDLWREANPSRFSRFAQALAETRSAVEEGKLVLEVEHYNQIQEILQKFEDFKFGKDNLLNMRGLVAKFEEGRLFEAQATLEHFDDNEAAIREQINVNRRHKVAYALLLDEIGDSMRAQLEIESAARAQLGL